MLECFTEASLWSQSIVTPFDLPILKVMFQVTNNDGIYCICSPVPVYVWPACCGMADVNSSLAD